TSILDDLGDIFWGMIRNIAVAIIDTATAIVIEIKKSKKK
ncbi:TPA: cold shock domain-containing protein, partial [Klebsiella pneumoniae]|nr:cold shock domain-containing protein [Klebsiella pneumoniae]